MRRAWLVLVLLAAVALCVMVVPASAAPPLPACNGSSLSPCAIKQVGEFESAKIRVTVDGTASLTVHAVFNAHPNGSYFLEILGPENVSCFVDTPSTQPDGDWTCSLTGPPGDYLAIFETRDGGPVSGVLALA